MSRAYAVCLAAMSLFEAGCAENAILELQIELPAAVAGAPGFAEIMVGDAEVLPLRVEWDDVSPGALALTDSPQWDCVSVVGSDPNLDLNVRVRFCDSEDCLAPSDAEPRERLLHLERPFYIGRRTYVRRTIATLPRDVECNTDADCEGLGFCELTDPLTRNRCRCASDADCTAGLRCETNDFRTGETGSNRCVEVVDRCAIEGCVSGESSTFCDGSGLHFCEGGADVLRPESIECARRD